MRVASLNSELEKMFDKWQEKKPKERNQLTLEDAMETSEMMKELQQQWDGFCAEMEKVKRDFKYFSAEKGEPKFTFYDKMKDELEDSKKTWGLFEEFKKALDDHHKEEWLTYRKKGYFAF